MTLNNRISAIAELSNFMFNSATKKSDKIDKKLKNRYNELNKLIDEIHFYNPWYINDFVRTQIISLSEAIKTENLNKWLAPYSRNIQDTSTQNVAVIMAGNISLVGFHDFISVLICGHKFIGKLSSKDNKLPVLIADILIDIEPNFADLILFEDNFLKNYDAIIATGSNNTSRYFDYYFSKVPNIIRKNRKSVAILSGKETKKELENLADDIFLYFGFGCRNISKIFVPSNYNFALFYEALSKYEHLINHNKYANNFLYYRTIFIMNNIKYIDKEFYLLSENTNLHSPISVIHYEYYDKLENVEKNITNNKNTLQCIASNIKNITFETVELGQTQYPALDDYDDNINTIEFLINLNH